ncbi:uncharacterized protein CMC5_051120 [Chondromyces crocatus]|uniref:Uncharacterized protein n=1 Tax=Chondromyces crocatus TaxID=52 RepID=A0A0K1EJB7_CHOCO|nr:uncharacterized protein CMC5_051120 [Chondromyces crocatus]
MMKARTHARASAGATPARQARTPRHGERRPVARTVTRDIVRLALLLGLFVAAPVVGDIGSCGQTPEDLDAFKFFAIKAQLDCDRCTACGILSEACARACAPTLDGVAFPVGCYPLAHDGEVCLNALYAASCGAYEEYMADQGATTPTECNFCPLSEGPR